jgi:hypothetical protein
MMVLAQIPGPILEVLICAIILAQEAGAGEIGIDHLLRAAESAGEAKLPRRSAAPFLPVPRCEMNLSQEAAALFDSFADFENVTKDSFRSALLAAKRSGSS